MEEQDVCDQCAGEHQGPCSVDKTLIALSTSLRSSFQGTSRWSLSDTTAGLFKVYNLHALEGATDTINGVEVTDRNELEEMLEWMRWSKAAYKNDEQTLATNLEINNKDLVKMITKSGINKPAFFIGIHHSRKCVVMVIRGTNQKQDVFTDLNPHNEQFLQGCAHSGMLGAARWLFENEGQTLQGLLAKHLVCMSRGYKLILTGHSLGAATAGLLAMMIRATNGWFMPKAASGVPSSKILCWGYGCAPCVDRKLAESSNFICNIVLQDDIVARVSPAAVEALRNEIQTTSWSQVVKDETAKKLLDTIGQVSFGTILSTGAQAGAALFQKIDSFRSSYASTSSSSSAVVDQRGLNGTLRGILFCGSSASEKISTMEHNAGELGAGVAASEAIMGISTVKDDAKELDSRIAAQTVMVVATGSSTNMEKLERRRLFVPGVLYHVKRVRQQREGRISMSVPMFPGRGGEALKHLGSKYVVVRGVDPKERFGRIIVSTTMISDHSCPSYVRGISVALNSCLNP